MLPKEKMRWVGQTTYDKYQQRGFPEGCLDRSVLLGVRMEKLSRDFSMKDSSLCERRINGMVLDKLNLSGCEISDCIFNSLQIEELDVSGTAVYRTVFFGNRFGKMDFRDANLNHSIIQDCEMDVLQMDRAMLNGTSFYRIKHQTVTGFEIMPEVKVHK